MNVFITIGTIRYSSYSENIDGVYKLKKHAINYLKRKGFKYSKKEKLYYNESLYVRIEKHKLINWI